MIIFILGLVVGCYAEKLFGITTKVSVWINKNKSSKP